LKLRLRAAAAACFDVSWPAMKQQQLQQQSTAANFHKSTQAKQAFATDS